MTEMVKVYFDKNVLSHIISAQRGAAETNRVTLDDVKSLLSAVAEGKVMNLLSVMHLQGVLCLACFITVRCAR